MGDVVGARTGADLVICAQAWHWLDPQTRLERAWAALRRGGLLALFWNRDEPEGDTSGLGAAIEAAYQRVAPGLASRGPGRKGAPPWVEGNGEVVLDTSLSLEAPSTAQEYVDTLRTQSDHRLTEPAVLDELTGRDRRGDRATRWPHRT